MRRRATGLERLARLGYAAKGAVYVLIGVTALAAAVRVRSAASGPRGVLLSLLDEPFGRIVLLAVGSGLLAYVLWRFLQAVIDCDGKGRDPKGLAVRGFFLVNGLIYLSLALVALDLARGASSAGGEDAARTWSAEMMTRPAGRWIVAAAGVTLIGVGLYQGFRAWTVTFRKRLKTGEMSTREETWMLRVGRFGLATRGLTFLLIGWFVIRSALEADPSEARGLEGVLSTLENQALGPWLLAAVALGLSAYGLFQLTMARYRRIEIR